MLGERGGTTASVEEARELQEEMKPFWSKAIRAAILNALEACGEFHADDLLTLGIPADCKNIVGAQINALVKSGRIEETGERRKSTAPESHGRKSNVYRLRRGGSSEKGNSSPCQSAAATSGEGVDTPGGDGSSPAVTALPTLFEVEPSRPGHIDLDQRAA